MKPIRMSTGGTTTLALAVAMALAAPAGAQAPSAQDHEAHHPDGATAQGTPAPTPAPPPSRGGMPGMMDGDMARMMPMMQRRMAELGMTGAPMRPFHRIEGQLAYYRAELRITDAQMPQWNAFADAIRASAQKLQPIHAQAMQAAAGQPLAAPAQLEAHVAVLSAMLETSRAVAAAMQPLYAALSDEQKRTADELLAEHMRDMWIFGH